MPKDRHKGTQVRAWLSDDDFRRFDRLRAGCKTDKSSFLKLLELAEAEKQESEAVHNKVKTLESQIDKLLHDLKDRGRKIEELEKNQNLGLNMRTRQFMCKDV
jgi:deoxyadenosine/deoxycytidine kinase